VPNLLVNGSSGIAVGMATNIPPHNLSEVVDALVLLIDNAEASIEDLMKVIPGPDFPTYGYIYGRAGIREAYTTGRGIITLRAKAHVEKMRGGREAIIVTELPYQVNKASLIEKIGELIRDKRIEGISERRDESSREGIRIVLELGRGEIPQIAINQLYKHTAMQTTFGVIMLALVGRRPQVVNLKQMLQEFITFRREVVTRRTQYDLARAEERAHILEGLRKAIDQLDLVLRLIRQAENPEAARDALMRRLELSEIRPGTSSTCGAAADSARAPQDRRGARADLALIADLRASWPPSSASWGSSRTSCAPSRRSSAMSGAPRSSPRPLTSPSRTCSPTRTWWSRSRAPAISSAPTWRPTGARSGGARA
jgi:DNA gyrase/topoisomerase IV subunit A